jgi:hypothetical protein
MHIDYVQILYHFIQWTRVSVDLGIQAGPWTQTTLDPKRWLSSIMYFIKQHFGKYFAEHQTSPNLSVMFN